MSGQPVLSAVARRRAKFEAAAAAALDSPQKTNDTGAPVDITLPATGITPSLPLKRKTSARSLKQNGHSSDQTIESQTRKKLKAPQYPRITPATEKPASLDYPRERPYSPSQPLDISSDEDGGTLFVPGVPGFVHTESDASTHPTKNIPSLTERDNYFILTHEDAYSITGRRTAARIVLLNQGESLLFVGTMELTLLQGSVRLLGTTLTPSRTSHRIFAPRSHPIPVLDALGQLTGTSQESSQNKAQLVSRLPGHIIESVSSSHVVLVLQELVTGVNELGGVVQPFAGIFEPDIRERNATERILESLHIYRNESQFDTSFNFPDDWQQAIASILSATSSEEPSTLGDRFHDAPVILVKGAKNSGKSSFSRSLANSLTSRVAFIECDLGQSEFTPGGMVSLNILKSPVFGPPFTHLSLPRCAHFVGGSSPKTSPSHYLAALGDLAQRYQLELKYSGSLDDDIIEDDEPVKNTDSVPLVINTQGWVKGMGADLLRSIEELFAPTHVVDFQPPHVPSSIEPFHNRPGLFPEESDQILSNKWGRSIKLLPIPASTRSPRFSAADLRSLAFASYFYGRTNHKNKDHNLNGRITHWDTSLPLRSVAPIAIDISSLESITIVAPGGDDVVPADLPRAIVCGVVGLVAPDSVSTPPGTAYTQGALPPPPQSSRCVGLGFVRGASATRLHILTPVPASQLRLCQILILGELTMPVWAFLESEGGTVEEGGIPFLQWGKSIAEDAGGERRRIRRNIMRRGQL
ncbi:Polynucleotide 5'-hydroxyl-kinase grc3 [Ceratobasidium sp. 423]|nr:Polynucleotide 5'-hydroxyl-kinase grc3 [Ceratobasidium sp. 423]